ncbi:MAG: hypothetical protein NWR51_13540 [Akkermansiaceae bacterium]|nr:hypothetical protein [Akkermansiaceae bacterium]MDP4996584.1 hypothetical protein [Akkermansiaceae bacterium]
MNGDFVGGDFRQGTPNWLGYCFFSIFPDNSLTNVDGINYNLFIDGADFASLALANSTKAIDKIRVFNDTSEPGNDVL